MEPSSPSGALPDVRGWSKQSLRPQWFRSATDCSPRWQNYAPACRRVGHPLADRIHANDLWIAASAIHIDAPVVTADTVFLGAPGLMLA